MQNEEGLLVGVTCGSGSGAAFGAVVCAGCF